MTQLCTLIPRPSHTRVTYLRPYSALIFIVTICSRLRPPIYLSFFVPVVPLALNFQLQSLPPHTTIISSPPYSRVAPCLHFPLVVYHTLLLSYHQDMPTLALPISTRQSPKCLNFTLPTSRVRQRPLISHPSYRPTPLISTLSIHLSNSYSLASHPHPTPSPPRSPHGMQLPQL